MKNNFDLPAIVIAGRKNVGKSSIFNRIIGYRRSLVADYEGLTRDPVVFDMELNGKSVRIVDLPGYFFDPHDDIEKEMNAAFIRWLSKAALVLFVVDGRTSITQEDIEIAQMIRKNSKEHLLIVNKAESKAYLTNISEVYALSMGEPIFVAAEHNIGFDLLESKILEKIPDNSTEIKRPTVKVSIIGRPNVGKSSLLNAIFNEYISIVTDIPGTTRDTIDASLDYDDLEIMFIDTAGLRKRGKVEKGTIESFSGARTIRAIMNSDICVLVLDASEGLFDQDKKIASMILKYSKASVCAFNKWDKAIPKFESIVDKELPFISYSPKVPVSAKKIWNIQALLKAISQSYRSYTAQVPTSKIAKFSSTFSGEHSIPSKLKIYYATQVDTAPPTISVFVNSPEFFDDGLKRSFTNFLRKQIDELKDSPIKIIVKARR